jgi:hypothetical protein
VLEAGDVALASILRDEVFADAMKAREDIFTFFEFVMRRFDKREPIQLAAHQRVLLEFFMAHDRSVAMCPVGSSKTWIAVGLALFFLGQNPESRGAVVSATEGQAKKFVQLVRGYITESPELRMVFPHLIPSQRDGEQWTQTSITVQRSVGIKDASLTAYGIDSPSIVGSRLAWVIVDDILSDENTYTPESRDHVLRLLNGQVLSRLDPIGSKVIMINTPWHPDDVVHHARDKRGWATIRMDIYGDIEVWDDASTEIETHPHYGKYWDSDMLRPAEPANTNNRCCRLVAHEPDPDNSVPLWPEERPIEWIENTKRELNFNTLVFNRNYRCLVRDDESSMCKQVFVDRCLKMARDLGIYGLVSVYKGPYLTFTGVDLAFAEHDKADETAFFTFEARPGGINVILDIEIGRWDSPTVIQKIIDKQKAFNSTVRVESNAAQIAIKQFALQRDKSLPIKAHMTGRAKAHPEYGVPGLFSEMENAAWVLPNSPRGQQSPQIERFIRDCLHYVPSKHTADILMAAYFAREQKREWMGLSGKGNQAGTPGQPSAIAGVMSR